MTLGANISEDSLYVSANNCKLTHIEHVTATVSFSYNRYRGMTELYLVSPSGTESHILSNRDRDAVKNEHAGNITWTYMSVHYWGESPIGNWKLKAKSHRGFTIGK